MFKELKVIELASVLAGPAVGMFFAELGADVIKIENKKTGGDVTRTWKLASESPTTEGSAYFYSVNYGKKHYFLDVESPNDKLLLDDLIKDADIIISNYKYTSAERFGLDYASVKRLAPKVIYSQLYGFDEQDETPAFDVVLQAETGFMYMNGEKNGNPVKMPVALIDILAAHQLKEGILMALLQREKTGKGAFVSTSLYASALSSLANQATNWLMVGHIPQRMGAQHPNIAPYGDIFRTKDDKMLVLACGTEKQWQQLARALHLTPLIDNPLFQNNQKRVENRVALNEILEAAIQQFSSKDIAKLLSTGSEGGGRVPFGFIKNMEEVFNDEKAQKMILEEDIKGEITRRAKSVAFEIKD